MGHLVKAKTAKFSLCTIYIEMIGVPMKRIIWLTGFEKSIWNKINEYTGRFQLPDIDIDQLYVFSRHQSVQHFLTLRTSTTIMCPMRFKAMDMDI
jgi:hypothetical protein